MDDTGVLQIESSEACFIYTPSGGQPASRPSKKRKTTGKKGSQGSSLDAEFPKLFDGRENAEFVHARGAALSSLWTQKQAKLEDVLEETNTELVSNITEFLVTIDMNSSSRQLPAGLINAGLATSASGSMFDSVVRQLPDQGFTKIRIHSSECHNLKASLKTIIQRGTAEIDVDSEDEDLLKPRGGRQLLNYDLQTLYNHVQARDVKRCIIFFQNSEALDPQVLAELVDVLLSWRDRIPFVVLFEMAISVELFQDKLARSTVRQLRGALFESKSASEILDILFSEATKSSNELSLLIGPGVSRLLLDQQTEQLASAKGFISALKYCYMMHFYHNPLSFLCANSEYSELQKEHIEYLKALPSFDRHLQILAGDGDRTEVQKLAKDNKYLQSQVLPILERSRAALDNIEHALELLVIINELTSLRPGLTYSSLYIKALASELAGSPIVRELVEGARKLPAGSMLELLTRAQALRIFSPAELDFHLTSLRVEIAKSSSNTCSTYASSTETVRTTVQGQKVVLDKGKKVVPPHVASYTKLVDRIDLVLVSTLTKTLVTPRDVCFHEILVFDGKNQCRDALGAAPRAALERALSRPHDYLACSCCDVMEGQLAASQPATALVYQLYLESGATINIQDLWMAFKAIVGPDDADENEAAEAESSALFHRALAELRYVGMLKDNKRKADHLAKVRWKGL